MGRLRWPERVTDQAGNGIVQASCTFTHRDAGTPVVVYPDRLGSIASSQPLLADRNGEVVAYVDEADLPVRVTAALDGWTDTFDWEFPGQAIPTGGAGGVLSGQYPNPGFANDMAFQSELDSVQAALQAQIATIPTSATGAAGGDLTGTYPNPTIGAGKVTAVKLAADAVDSSKVQDGSLALGDLSAAGVRDATKFLRGDNSWAVPAGKPVDALSADIPEKVAWESPAGTDVVELYGLLTPAGYALKATDDFSSDTIAAGAWTNFGGVGLAISGGKLTAGGAGQTRTLRWTLQGASAVVRKARIKFTISSGLPTNFNSTMPCNVWLGASDFIRPETNFISSSDVRLSIVKVDSGVRTNLADGTSKTQAAWSVAGTWTGEAERNGDLLTARLWAPGLSPDVDPPTGIVSVTLAGANKTKFGAGVSSYPALAVEDSPGGGWDDATLYEQQLEQRDLYAAITPAGGARVVRRLLGFSGAALERSDLPLDLAVTTAKLADGAVTSAKILDGTIVDSDVAAGNKDGSAATPSLRTLGTGAAQAAAGNDARFGSGGPPTGAASGDLTGTYPAPTIGTGKVTSAHILDGTITDTDVAAANKDGAVGTASLRTLGSGALQAAPGNDARFTAAGPPNGVAGGDLAGSYPNPTIGTGKVAAAQVLDGSLGIAELSATGVRDATTYLRGDNSFAVPPGGSSAPNLFAHCVRAGATTISNSVWTNVPFDTDVSLTDVSMHSLTGAATALTGTVSKAVGVTVTGIGTSFLSQVRIGDLITIPGTAAETRTVVGVGSNTSLTVDSNFANAASGQTATVDARSRIVVPQAGVYDIAFWAAFASNGTGYRGASVTRFNASPASIWLSQVIVAAVSGTRTHLQGSAQAKLAAGDHVTLQVLQNAGVALTVDTYYPPSLSPGLSVAYVAAG